jgi:hypothetical protein
LIRFAYFIVALAWGSSLIAEESVSVEEPPISATDRGHWAFRPIVRPELPRGGRMDEARHPIDRFVLAQIEARSLAPLPEANRNTLIRRLTFDLTGLPPAIEEVNRFVENDSPDAYEALVDRLLASPRYGERWGQHWLDLARFAETDGFEHDKVRAQAWRYRDWVIQSLNNDLPYDDFVRLQLAGDELLPGDDDAKTATAFCLSGPDMPDINSQDERRHMLLNEMTSTVGSVFLGLQIGCAQCHDHKYDPISQADFHRLRAFFEPAIHPRRDEPIATLADSPPRAVASFIMVRGDHRRPGPEIRPGFPRIANPWNETLAAPSDAPSGRRAVLARWITRPNHPLTVRVIVNRVWQYHFGRGLVSSSSDFGVMGSTPTHPELLDWLASEFVRNDWSLKHLHRLIVTSAAYRRASRATESGWTASEREQALIAWDQAAAVDPDNELLGRFPMTRLDGESIRDAMLSVAGMLNTRSGGPGVMPPLPLELKRTLLPGQWKTSEDESEHFRRGVYIFARRNLRYPILDVFDRPDAQASCPRRNRATTVSQPLLMLNSEFSQQVARRFARRAIEHSDGDLVTAIEFIVRKSFSREPTSDELMSLTAFCQEHAEYLQRVDGGTDTFAAPLFADAGFDGYHAAALIDLCLAVLNSSEFIYID